MADEISVYVLIAISGCGRYNTAMNNFDWYGNRYVRMTFLAIVGTVTIYLLFQLMFNILNFTLPNGLVFLVSALASGYLVYLYSIRHIA